MPSKKPSPISAVEKQLEAQQANQLRYLKAIREGSDATFSAASAFEHASLKALYLLNGGAAISLLAFVGRIWGNEGTSGSLQAVVLPMYCYLFGLAFAFLATAAGYASQEFFHRAATLQNDLTARLEAPRGSPFELQLEIDSIDKDMRRKHRAGGLWLFFGGIAVLFSFASFVLGSIWVVRIFTAAH